MRTTRSCSMRRGGAMPSATARSPCARCARRAARRPRCWRWPLLQRLAQAGDERQIIGLARAEEAVAEREIDEDEIDVELELVAAAHAVEHLVGGHALEARDLAVGVA